MRIRGHTLVLSTRSFLKCRPPTRPSRSLVAFGGGGGSGGSSLVTGNDGGHWGQFGEGTEGDASGTLQRLHQGRFPHPVGLRRQTAGSIPLKETCSAWNCQLCLGFAAPGYLYLGQPMRPLTWNRTRSQQLPIHPSWHPIPISRFAGKKPPNSLASLG